MDYLIEHDNNLNRGGDFQKLLPNFVYGFQHLEHSEVTKLREASSIVPYIIDTNIYR